MLTPCILIPVLVGLLCALLGYFLGRYTEKSSEVYKKLRSDLEHCNRETGKLLILNGSLQTETDQWKDKFNTLRAEFDKLNPKLKTGFLPEVVFDAESAASGFGKRVVPDDLKIVEGIGPKIEELFHAAGIYTWKALAETSVELCQDILDNAGEKYRIHKPGTWPKQAEMAYLGKWHELRDWQDSMRGGRE